MYCYALVEAPGTSADIRVVDVAEYDETGATFALPENFDEVQIVFSAPLPTPANEEVAEACTPHLHLLLQLRKL